MENQIIRHNLKYHQVVPNIVLSMTCETLPFFSALHEGHGRPRSVRKSSRLRGKCLSKDCICSGRRKSFGPSAPIAYATSVSPPNEAAAWPGRRCWMLDMTVAWLGAAFLQITEHTNPCSRHLWGTLACAVASICAHRARLQKLTVWL